MPGIREELLTLFKIDSHKWADYAAHKAAEVYETGNSYHVQIVLKPESIPDVESIRIFLQQIENQDIYVLDLKNIGLGESNGPELKIEGGLDVEEYNRFNNLFDNGAEISVELNIQKNLSKDRIYSVYEWDAFAEFLLKGPDNKKSLKHLSNYLNSLLKKHPEGINFLVLDQNVDFATESISFVNSKKDLVCMKNRSEVLERYNGISLYLGRTEDLLLPGDFHANISRSYLPGRSGQAVKELFGHWETVYSLVYLSAASWFENKELVVELKKGGKRYRLPVAEIRHNAQIYELTDWVFDGDHSLEKAEIVRDILTTHCLKESDILSIGGEIKESAASSYKLYTQKVIDQYIAIKRDVIKSIFDSTKQVQELYSTLADNLGKNFVAVITVIISQVLANHINWELLKSKAFINEEFQMVVIIYFVASVFYMLLTMHTIYTKWSFYKDRYNKIREQYKYLLDEEELNKAFDNDRLIKKAQSRIIWYSVIIFTLWIWMITFILMIAFKASAVVLGRTGTVFFVILIISYVMFALGNKEEKTPVPRHSKEQKKR